MKQYLNFLKQYVYIKKNMSVFIITYILVMITSCSSFASPLISKLIIDGISINKDINSLNTLAVVSILLILVVSLLGFLQNYIINNLVQKISLNTRFRFFKHIQSQSWDFYDKYKAGELQYRMFNDITILSENASILPINLSLNLLVLLIANIVMIFINWKINIFINTVLVINSLLYLFFQKRVELYTKNAQNESEKVYGLTQEQFLRLKLSQLCTAKHIEKRLTFGALRKLFKTLVKKNVFIANSNITLNIVSGLWSTGILWIGGHAVINGNITIGDLVAFISITGLLFPVSTSIVSTILQYPVIKVSLTRFYDIMENIPLVNDCIDAKSYVIKDGSIEFKNVDFAFSINSRNILNNANFRINGGSFNLIVGPSGIGKSTILKLIGRFYDVRNGQIEIDSIDLRDYKLDSLRNQIGYVGGYSTVFTGTVMENISYGSKSVLFEDIIAAAQQACIHERIMQLPDGYFTLLGTKGVDLSDGEKQRINLARCFLNKPRIWLLDEATSNLDSSTEEQILFNLSNLPYNATILMVTHRKEMIKYADTLIDLTDGTCKFIINDQGD